MAQPDTPKASAAAHAVTDPMLQTLARSETASEGLSPTVVEAPFKSPRLSRQPSLDQRVESATRHLFNSASFAGRAIGFGGSPTLNDKADSEVVSPTREEAIASLTKELQGALQL